MPQIVIDLNQSSPLLERQNMNNKLIFWFIPVIIYCGCSISSVQEYQLPYTQEITQTMEFPASSLSKDSFVSAKKANHQVITARWNRELKEPRNQTLLEGYQKAKNDGWMSLGISLKSLQYTIDIKCVYWAEGYLYLKTDLSSQNGLSASYENENLDVPRSTKGIIIYFNDEAEFEVDPKTFAIEVARYDEKAGIAKPISLIVAIATELSEYDVERYDPERLMIEGNG